MFAEHAAEVRANTMLTEKSVPVGTGPREERIVAGNIKRRTGTRFTKIWQVAPSSAAPFIHFALLLDAKPVMHWAEPEDVESDGQRCSSTSRKTSTNDAIASGKRRPSGFTWSI